MMRAHLSRSGRATGLLLGGSPGLMPVTASALAPGLNGAGTIFLVNSTADAVDAVQGHGGVCATATGLGSLRAAIQESNALLGTQTIKVPAGIYELTLLGKGEQAGDTSDLSIIDPVSIEGAGADKATGDGGVRADIQDPGGTSEDVGSTNDRVLSIPAPDRQVQARLTGAAIRNGGGSSRSPAASSMWASAPTRRCIAPGCGRIRTGFRNSGRASARQLRQAMHPFPMPLAC